MAERTVICAWCSTQFTAKRSDARFCSQKCRYGPVSRRGLGYERACEDCGGDISGRMGTTRFCRDCYALRPKTVHAAKQLAKRPWFSQCRGCGTQFAAPRQQQFCNSKCSGKYGHAKRGPRTGACLACDTAFTTLDSRKRTCSVACRQWVAKHPGEKRPVNKTCVTCERRIDSVHPKQKYCSDACRPSHRPAGRASTLPLSVRLRTAKCAYCAAEFTTGQTLKRYCSEQCGGRALKATYAHAEYERRLGRTCKRCGGELPKMARIDQQFCSTRCQCCYNQELRRVRKRGLPVEPISRYEIFERDNYTCHICSKTIEDKPVLDHIIPLAVEGCPGHVWENLAAPHAYCNAAKNSRVRPEDYRLYVELSLGGSFGA